MSLCALFQPLASSNPRQSGASDSKSMTNHFATDAPWEHSATSLEWPSIIQSLLSQRKKKLSGATQHLCLNYLNSVSYTVILFRNLNLYTTGKLGKCSLQISMKIESWHGTTYIVITGATTSRLAIRIPISDIANVSNKALNGSPRFVVTEKKLITGITPSIAIACNNLGAPENNIQIWHNNTGKSCS